MNSVGSYQLHHTVVDEAPNRVTYKRLFHKAVNPKSPGFNSSISSSAISSDIFVMQHRITAYLIKKPTITPVHSYLDTFEPSNISIIGWYPSLLRSSSSIVTYIVGSILRCSSLCSDKCVVDVRVRSSARGSVRGMYCYFVFGCRAWQSSIDVRW